MAYGKRKEARFFQFGTGIQVDVEIHSENYTDPSTTMSLGGNPIQIRMSSVSSGDKFAVVKGKEATINVVILPGEDDFSWIYDGDDYQFKIIIKRDTTVYWTGFVLADQFSEQNLPYRTLQIIANDQLGLLGNRPYTFGSPKVAPTGWRKAIEIISAALWWTKLELHIRTDCDLFEESMSYADTDDPFDQTYVNQDLWVNNDGISKSCKDVIENILELFECRITQSQGYWWIQWIPALAEASLEYREFDEDGAYVGELGYNPQLTTDRDDPSRDLIPIVTGIMEISPAWQQRSLIVDYGLRESLVPFFNLPDEAFTQDNPAIITGWTNTGNWMRLNIDGTNILRGYTDGKVLVDTGLYILTPAVEVSDAKPLQIDYRTGHMASGLTGVIKPRLRMTIYVTNGVSTQYWNYAEGWKITEFTGIFKVPQVEGPENLVDSFWKLDAPPFAGDLYIKIYEPWKGLGSTWNSYTFISDLKLRLQDSPELGENVISSRTYNIYISDDTNYVPGDKNIVLSDGLGDNDLIPYYKGFITIEGDSSGAIGEIGPGEWRRKSDMDESSGGVIQMPIIEYSDEPTTNSWILEMWYTQYYLPNKKYKGSFRGIIYFHNTIKFNLYDDIVFIIDDVEVDLKNNSFTGTFIEIKSWIPGDNPLANSMKFKGLKDDSANGLNGATLITTPGGDEGELQFKSGEDFDGTVDITWDGTRVLKGALPLIDYKSDTVVVSSGEQTVSFLESFESGDVYTLTSPIAGISTDSDEIILWAIPYDMDDDGFKVNFPMEVTINYLAIIER